MTYRVRITPAAEDAIFDQYRHIAIEQRSPQNAEQWIGRIDQAIDTLDEWPRRCAIAEEDKHRPYEVRKLSIDGFTLLLTVLDDRNEVWVIGTRGRGQLPKLDELPDDVPGT